ncbi:BnaCnng27290D [Brassica napus]|uniref:BnaCnng27290D protein n=1 Tax=Brassica napus TaxID=3708 RepID=A0A078ITQ7_BRANA|nr:BnaCnng27290D [Brassica napus]
MAEYYSEIVFPDPFESFFTYVCYYLAVHISNLPLGAFLLWCLLTYYEMTKVDNKDNSVCVWFLKFSDADELKRQLIMVDRQPEEF